MALLYTYRISKYELDEWSKMGFEKIGLARAKKNAMLAARKKAESLGLNPDHVVVEDGANGVFICKYPDELA